MKKKILIILIICLTVIVGGSLIQNQIQKPNENLQIKNLEINKSKKENKLITVNLNKKHKKYKKRNEINEVKQQTNSYNKEITYLDTLIEGKETFTSYKNIIKNFGQPQKIEKIVNKSGVYFQGHFSILIYDGIEFVVNTSGNSKDPFYINDEDEVCRVDIVSDKYVLNRSYFNNLNVKIGDLAPKVANVYNKEIINIDNKDSNEMSVLDKLRNDMEKFKKYKGIYFSGSNENGLGLAILLLVNEKGKVSRIVMGFPTAG